MTVLIMPCSFLKLARTGSIPKYLYPVLAHGGIGFSPFGIDDNGLMLSKAETEARLAEIGQEYALAGTMMRELAQWGFEGKIHSVVEDNDHSDQRIDLGSWEAIVIFKPSGRRLERTDTLPVGKVMVVKLAEDELLLIGTNCNITFRPLGKNPGKAWQFLKVEEGCYENGKFRMLRIRNGDETDYGGPRFGSKPVVLHTTLTVR